MKSISIAVCAALALSGCTIVPTGPAQQACRLLQVASSEADMAPAWYIDAGAVLERCGQQGARADGERRACFASAQGGYRDSKDCEAMP
ncbi:hypothetical protein [Acidovorax sp. PRC11]|uniref:hypothetical protein n=1 Tax=Acidovorax sp. PRC11 TaxID=2962592 RepID=UPI0028815D20|nr:hypothetical protein [Acidovorax sp. PRC11]MDT0138095.1 hypothetical protein [Acidovorax sp. PRC11]